MTKDAEYYRTFDNKNNFLCYAVCYTAFLSVGNLQSIAKEMVPARNAIGVHACNFVVNDELLLHVLKASVQCTCSLHTAQNA
jgi:hypothetical protein